MAKKRSDGTGCVRKRSNGTWRAEIMDGFTPDGKKNIIRFSGKSKGDVLDKIRAYHEDRDAGHCINKDLTLSEWSDTWYADYKSQVQPSTYSGYRYTLALLKERLGSKALCEVLPIDINRMQDNLVSEGYSLSQISKCRAMLIQIFDSADDNGLVAKNPARKAKVIRDKGDVPSQRSQQKDAFTEEEVSIMRNKLPNDLLGNSILTMIDSGIRVQELLALTRDDIAEDGSSIEINKAIKTVDGRAVLGPPKSMSSNRIVPIPEICRKHVQFLREYGGKEFIWSKPGCNEHYGVGSFRRRYYTALKNLEDVRLLSPHCCRHTYATRLQAKGVPLELIAKLAGHANITTTQGYTHTTNETLLKAVSVLDEQEVNNHGGKR